jgi:hypothetical protein
MRRAGFLYNSNRCPIQDPVVCTPAPGDDINTHALSDPALVLHDIIGKLGIRHD